MGVTPSPRLDVEVGGIRLKNPVILAAGTFGYGAEYAAPAGAARLGAVVAKSITPFPRPGNPPPRVAEMPAGMLNSVGLENPGLEGFLRDELPRLARLGPPVLASIAGETVRDYLYLARGLDAAPGLAGMEVNVSCPNLARGRIPFGSQPRPLFRVVEAVRSATRLPVWVKLSPNVTSIVPLARAAKEAGADALCLINTLTGLAIDIERRRPALGAVFGGLSGPAIKPVALRMVWEVAEALDLPLVGMGGIMDARDALEFVMAGATAVAVGTATFVNPRAAVEVLDGIVRYLKAWGLESVSELVGAAHPGAADRRPRRGAREPRGLEPAEEGDGG
ncbi:MAG: dihydroorotate dehydrogenase [Acetobacteraceae bacterium]|nr:dihydroorotate dehydrogenase [Acetobacteraceae bacterium]